MEQQIQLNDHNKQEYPPMHTAEHLLNATMVKKGKKVNVTIFFPLLRQRNKFKRSKIR